MNHSAFIDLRNASGVAARSAVAGLALLLLGCPKQSKPGDDRHTSLDPARPSDTGHLLAIDGSRLALPPAPPVPAVPVGLPALPAAASAAIAPDAVALGELLFHDPRLSRSGTLSCASCHDPARGYSGDMATTDAGEPNLRRTPALVNLAWQPAFGWDGRYPSIDALLPVHVRGQLGNELEPALARISDLPLYRAHFDRIGGVAREAAVRALAAYALTRYSGDSPWDRLEPTARQTGLSDPIVAGYELFMGRAQCGTCHTPPLYTDFGYHRVAPSPSDDPGRGKVDAALDRAFKTPSLRGAAARTAFFHVAPKHTLGEVLDYYGGEPGRVFGASPHLDPIVTKLRMTPAEATKVLAFVRALTPETPPPMKPALP